MPNLRFLKSPQWWRYASLVVTVFAISVGDVFWAAHHLKKPERGGEGGAIGVAIAFLILFLRRHYGEKSYESRLDKDKGVKAKRAQLVKGEDIADFTSHEITTVLIAVMERIELDSAEQSRLDRAVFTSSVLAALFVVLGPFLASLLTP